MDAKLVQRHLRAIDSLPIGFSVDVHGKRWRLRFRRTGRAEVRRSFRTLEEALRCAGEVVAPDANRQDGGIEGMTLSKVCDLYELHHLPRQRRTRASFASELEALSSLRASPLADRAVNTLMRVDLVEWAKQLREDGRATATIKTRLATLVRVVRKAARIRSLHMDAQLRSHLAADSPKAEAPSNWYEVLRHASSSLGRSHLILFLLVADSGLKRSEIARIDGGHIRRRRVPVPFVIVPPAAEKRDLQSGIKFQISSECSEAIGDLYSASAPLCFGSVHRVDAAWKAITKTAGIPLPLRTVQVACRKKRATIDS